MEIRFLEELSRLIPPGSGVLLGVSGGPDSMAMLHLFAKARKALLLRVEAAHLHHGLRGPEADQDAAFVQEACAKLEIPFKLLLFDVGRFARSRRISVEEAGRRVRQHFLQRYARVRRLEWVSLAHHRDDQVETVFMNLARGSGTRGLGGMLPKQGVFIRPLLTFWRREVLDYLGLHAIPVREDSSNRDLRFFRNRIRRRILPFLELELGEQFRERLWRCAEIVREEEAWMEEITEGVYRLRVREIHPGVTEIRMAPGEFPVAQERRLLRRLLLERAGSLEGKDFHLIETLRSLLRKGSGKQVEFPPCFVERTKDGLAISFMSLTPWQGEAPLAVPGETVVPPLHVRLITRVLPYGMLGPGGSREAFLDSERVGQPVRVRTRRPGDSFVPAGSPGRKKLQDYFVDRKVPKLLRSLVPILDSPGGIVWVGGYEVDERFKATRATRRVLHVRMEHA